MLALGALLTFMPPVAGAATDVTVTVKDDGGTAVSGVTVVLLKDANSEYKTGTTDASGVATIAAVDDGSYAAKVKSVPTGFVAREDIVNFAVSGTDVNGGAAISLTVDRASSEVTFPIVDVRGNAVVGAVFNVAARNGSFIENFTTSADGLTLDLPEGTYVITNVQTPASHEISRASCTITVDSAGKVTYSNDPSDVFVLEIAAHTLTFTKRDDGGNPVPGAVFHIAGSGVNTTATSDSAGVVTFSGLLSEGSYILSERSAPSGYTRATATVTITVATDGAYTFDVEPETAFVNERATYQMTFSLRNDGGVAVSGAVFQLADENGNTYTATAELGTGRVLFSGIPFGTYTLTQTTAAEGYPANSGKVIVTIYSDGGISFSSDPAEVFVAERTRYAFSFTAKEERGGNLAGATFRLEGGSLTLTEKSGSDGKVSFGDLLPGTYTLSQTAVPAGYAPSTETVTVTVSEDGAVTFSDPPETTIVATIAKFSVSFDKMDDLGAPVAGAVFRLTGENYDVDVTSTTAGKVSFSGLSEGVYTLTERSAPTGYTLSNASITITVSSIGHTTYSRDPAQVFTNARTQYEFTFVTVDDTGEPIKDAVFTLTGDLLTKEGTSNRKGRVTFNKLPHGTYILRQKAAPEGYTKSPLTVQVTIEPSGRIRYALVVGNEGLLTEAIPELDGVFINTTGPISFSFSAVSDDMRPLPGADFALINRSTGESAIATSNSAGIAAFYGIHPGSYTLRQTEAPEHYVPSGDEYTVAVDAGGWTSVTLLARPGDLEAENTLLFEGELTEGETEFFPSVVFISERERRSVRLLARTQYGKVAVPNAAFTLVAQNDPSAVVGLLITGQDGRATLDGVSPGSYRIVPESAPTGYAFVDTSPVSVTVPEEGEPETAVVEFTAARLPVATTPGGVIASAIGFLTDNAVGVAAGGVSLAMLAGFLVVLLKR